MTQHEKLTNIPTSIITGFLGTGKTSAILHLLKDKPANERWAVLVNEFGEVGVDGSLVEGQTDETSGVFIREVPGGCMCCTAGLPMQVALKMLLSRSRPDRLLVEPTGLGHPRGVLKVLSGEHYKHVLSVQKVVTLVDARKLADRRYTEHETFNQQIELADVLVGNKTDLYNDRDREALRHYADQHSPANVRVEFTEHGQLDPAWLEGPTEASTVRRKPHAHGHNHTHNHDHSHDAQGESDLEPAPIPEIGYLKVENRGEGFRSVGWRFAATQEFNRQKLVTFLQSLEVERLKGVFITDCGVYGYNGTPDGLVETTLNECVESRVEWISPSVDDAWEKELLACVSVLA